MVIDLTVTQRINSPSKSSNFCLGKEKLSKFQTNKNKLKHEKLRDWQMTKMPPSQYLLSSVPSTPPYSIPFSPPPPHRRRRAAGRRAEQSRGESRPPPIEAEAVRIERMDGGGKPDGDPVPDMDMLMLSSALDGLDSYTDLVAGSSVADSIFSALTCFPPSQQRLLHVSTAAGSSSRQDDANVSITEEGTTTRTRSDRAAGLASGEPVAAGIGSVPKPFDGVTLTERMLRALAMLKEASGGEAILVQVWMPVRNGEQHVLTTSDQPFLLDQKLRGYREVSRQFTFSAEEGPGLFPGMPGRVFMSGMPEWTSNVMYYHGSEYLRVDYARRHEVRGSLAMPVFNSSGGSCCAVLEVVMTREKDNFCLEMVDVSNALQSYSRDQKLALMEIFDVLQAVCQAHLLPLALAWIPVCSKRDVLVSVEYGAKFGKRNKEVLCIEESACYVNDTRMRDFVQVCAEHPLEKGQGVTGNAYLSNNPFFSSDVKDSDMHAYPLVNHARKFGLHAAVAIRLRSTYTKNDDYVLEFFLPVLCKGGEEQQLLLDSISATMRKVCKSLRTVSDAELKEDVTRKPSNENRSGTRCPSPVNLIYSGREIDVPNETKTNTPLEYQIGSIDEQLADTKSTNKLIKCSNASGEKRRSSSEKSVSLSVLQQYFSGSLKDAAKSIGVCPTTLKRICRQHGISRWPSRKIKKVNRSLKKIQNVISSVHGVEGVLKYDPSTGCLISSVSPSIEPVLMNVEHKGQDVLHKLQNKQNGEINFDMDDGELFRNSHSTRTLSGAFCEDMSNGLYVAREMTCAAKTGTRMERLEHKPSSRDSFSTPQEYRTESETDKSNKNAKQSLPSSSSMTDCSSGGISSGETFKSIKSQSANESNTTVVVKASYKNDTIRFKLLPSMKYEQLLEEIAKRLKLSVGVFQLKYKDDEGDWVILASDADLQECLEILDTTRLHILKLQVQDVVCPIGSSSERCGFGSTVIDLFL
uniref:RWP-RK domain-containing protein n=1 Tax=Oryza meridionalis TaxID=40149 RepID=A0A0E0F4I8_9ORYZ